MEGEEEDVKRIEEEGEGDDESRLKNERIRGEKEEKREKM